MAGLYDPFNGLYTQKELEKVRKYLKEELHRSLKYLKKPGKPKTYYLGYIFRNTRQEKIFGRLGSIGEQSVSSQNTVFCDLRVGSYRYDNVNDGGLNDNSDKDESVDYIFTPAEIEENAFKYALWKLTDARYREAAEQYYDRESRQLHYIDTNRALPSKRKGESFKSVKYKKFPEIETDYWKYLIRKAGALVRKFTAVKNSWFEFTTIHRQSLLVNSEQTESLQQQCIFELRAFLWLLTSNGDGIVQEINLIEGDINNLPDEKSFLRAVQDKVDLLLRLQKAPVLNSYTGPVLLSGEASGLFFHEVIGHRLEGSRLLSTEEGATFRDLRGKKIAPEYIDIIDDPLCRQTEGTSLIGSFKYDDEGWPAKRVVLVEKGVLKNFLTTSMPIPDQKELNGHARNQRYERPISRMGNLFIVNRQPVPEAEMKERFLEEIRAQKKPYGIYVRDTLGGETGTSSYDFQAFKGEIMTAYRVFPNGKEEPVRGVDFVGTPLSALEAVVCMGAKNHIDNAYCGAESGIVPVSTISPSMLVRNLELQGRDREKFTQYAIPLPYDKSRKGKIK